MSRVAYLPRPASVLRVQANPHTCVPPASPPAMLTAAIPVANPCCSCKLTRVACAPQLSDQLRRAGFDGSLRLGGPGPNRNAESWPLVRTLVGTPLVPCAPLCASSCIESYASLCTTLMHLNAILTHLQVPSLLWGQAEAAGAKPSLCSGATNEPASVRGPC